MAWRPRRFRSAPPEDGVAQVRAFYDREGWQWVDGESGDARRWGTAAQGPVQRRLDEHRAELLRGLLRVDGTGAEDGRGVALLELGGGGQPAIHLAKGASSYTAVDLSGEGLKVARAAVEPLGIDAVFVQADVRSLPLGDGRFDVAYSAHMIYHLPTAEDQRRVLVEMARVVRPGGVLAVVSANPYPWLFLLRCLRRAIADMPLVGTLANLVRRPPPLPYLPMSSAWLRDVLAPFGPTELFSFGVPTT
ncbi:MAG: class I SAM-dependent methyltransferase, partial [Acidimicrobiales bacterium]